MGCARLGHADAIPQADSGDELSLEISLDKASYRPGEPVYLTVRLTNLNDQSLNLHQLSAHSLRFYAARENSEDQFAVPPVYSTREVPGESTTLEMNAYIERKFIFSQMTESVGTYLTMASYGSPVGRDLASERQDDIVRIAASPISFSVEGERAFVRDSAGLLLKDEAIELCRSEAQRRPDELDAILITNEAGFSDWWVFVREAGSVESEAGAKSQAWFVNPYLGVIRGGARRPPAEFYKEDKNYRITHRWAKEDLSDGSE